MSASQTGRRLAPLAPGLPILGNGIDLYRDTLGTFVRCYHEVGPIYRLRGPGRHYTVLAGPKANAFLLHGGERHFDSVLVYRRLAHELRTRNYPVATTGERHRHLRRTLRPAFSREAISHYVPKMIEVAGRVARAWRPGQRLRAPEVMRSLLAEQLGLAMANRPIGGRLRDAVTFARVSVGAGLGSYPAIARLWSPYLLARARMFAFLREIIAEHRRRPPGAAREPDLIDLLLAATDHTGVAFTEQDVIGNAQMIYSNSLLYIVTRGEVEVVNDHPSGEEIFLASLGPGEYFGEVGLVHDRPRMATVRAITEVEMMTLDREAFRELLSESERTSEEIAAVISERLAALHYD